MIRVTLDDIRAILRAYGVVFSLHSVNKLQNKKMLDTGSHSSAVSFTYDSANYVIFFDEFADNDESYIRTSLKKYIEGGDYNLISNPNSDDGFSSIHKGKFVYLLATERTQVRFDKALAKKFPNLSRSLLKKYILKGYAKVDGKVVDVAKTLVAITSDIEINAPLKTIEQEVEIPIIYQDDNVIVINKPAGILTHAKGAMSEEFTVADFFKNYCNYNLNSNRVGIVHRLDRDTSGVMIGARNQETAKMLQKQFSDRNVKKDYYAVVKGTPKLDKAIIDVPIGRDPKKPSQFRVDSRGKSANTFYQIKKVHDKECLVYLRPSTGRTHQLRVHMAYINTPIKGDRVYNKADSRMYLHAYSLELTIPGSKRMTFVAPLPDEFKKYE